MRRALHLLTLVLLPLCIGSSAKAQIRLRSRYLLTPTLVARAISNAMNERDATVSMPTVLLLAEVTASEQYPQFDVEVVAPSRMIQPKTGKPQIVVRVACHIAAVCLPFYAVVLSTAEELPAAFRLSGTKNLITNLRLPQPTIHSGEHATLVLEDGGLHLEVPVISLQSGAEGQSIRAISLDHKHIYTAHVLTATLLKGSF